MAGTAIESPCLKQTYSLVDEGKGGAFAGALAVAELVRGLHNGRRYDTAVISLRSLPYRKAILHSNESAIVDLARNGFSNVSLSAEDHAKLMHYVDIAEYL